MVLISFFKIGYNRSKALLVELYQKNEGAVNVWSLDNERLLSTVPVRNIDIQFLLHMVEQWIVG